MSDLEPLKDQRTKWQAEEDRKEMLRRMDNYPKNEEESSTSLIPGSHYDEEYKNGI